MEEFGMAFTGIVAVFCLFGLPVLAAAFVLVKLIGSSNKERLELVRHGIIPPVRSKPSPNKYRSLRNGILCIGVAAGLVAGLIVTSSYPECDCYDEKFLILCASVMLCLGLSYLVFYLIVKDKDMENEAE
jgi:hypothetical protein